MREGVIGQDPGKSSRDIVVHLQDGWIDTPAEVGDCVHVLADIRKAEGAANEMGHATCNSLSGMQPVLCISAVFLCSEADDAPENCTPACHD